MTVMSTPSPTASDLLQSSTRFTQINEILKVYASEIMLTSDKAQQLHVRLEYLRYECRLFNARFKQKLFIP